MAVWMEGQPVAVAMNRATTNPLVAEFLNEEIIDLEPEVAATPEHVAIQMLTANSTYKCVNINICNI